MVEVPPATVETINAPEAKPARKKKASDEPADPAKKISQIQAAIQVLTESWPQALALWQRAIATCPVEQPAYAEGVARCQRQIDVDVELASIARQTLQIPTLDARNSDRLDFHEVSVWKLLNALRLAYRAGQSTQ